MDFPLKHRRAPATVQIRNIAAIPAVLAELGFEPDAVLKKAGVTAALFDNPENVAPYAAMARAIATCVSVTGCDDFGLRVGVKSGAPAIGLTGLVAQNSRTVREGVGVLVGTLATVDTGGAAFLDVCEGVASIGYGVTAPGVEAKDHIEDLSIAIAANIMRRLCGAGWRPLDVAFARKPPRDRTLFARFFGAPLQFESARTCLNFPAALLDAPVGAYDAVSASVLTPLLEEAVANRSGGFLFSVKAAIRAQLVSGTLSRDRVCVMLDLNARTLAHRLGAYGVSYSSLADEVRFDAARTLLLNSKPLAEIAMALGFADQSAFTRAFKTWSGVTPARWRVDNGG